MTVLIDFTYSFCTYCPSVRKNSILLPMELDRHTEIVIFRRRSLFINQHCSSKCLVPKSFNTLQEGSNKTHFALLEFRLIVLIMVESSYLRYTSYKNSVLNRINSILIKRISLHVNQDLSSYLRGTINNKKTVLM